jgi:hypothetical protein
MLTPSPIPKTNTKHSRTVRIEVHVRGRHGSLCSYLALFLPRYDFVISQVENMMDVFWLSLFSVYRAKTQKINATMVRWLAISWDRRTDRQTSCGCKINTPITIVF